MTKVQDPALGLVEPHTVGLGPSIQPKKQGGRCSLCLGKQTINRFLCVFDEDLAEQAT